MKKLLYILIFLFIASPVYAQRRAVQSYDILQLLQLDDHPPKANGNIAQVYQLDDNELWMTDTDGYLLRLGQRYYADARETDQGFYGKGRSVNALIDAIGTSEYATIHLTHQPEKGDNTTYTFSTSETIPSNIEVVIEKGAIIDGTGTLTIDGTFEAGLHRCFGSSITILFGKGAVDKVCVDWFGADNSGASDSEAAIERAIASIQTGNYGTIYFEGQYDVDGTIDYSGSAITFLGGEKAIISHSPTVPNTDCISLISASGYQHYNTIKNLTVTSTTSNTRHLIHLDGQARFDMYNVYCQGTSSDYPDKCLYINGGMFCNYYSCEFYDSNTACIYIDDDATSTTQSFYSCICESSDGWGLVADRCTSTTFYDCTFESNTLGGANVGQIDDLVIAFYECHFENNTSGIDVQGGNAATGAFYSHIKIFGGIMLNNSDRTYAINLDNCLATLADMHISHAYYAFQYGSSIKGITVIQSDIRDSGTSAYFGSRGSYTGPSAQEYLIHGFMPDVDLRSEGFLVSGGLGSELITNGDFANWTGDDPDNWTVVNEDADDYITEVAGPAAHFVNLNGTLAIYQSPSFTPGKLYRISLDMTDATSNGVYISLGGTIFGTSKVAGGNITTEKNHIYYAFAGSETNNFLITRAGAGVDVTFDDVSLKEVTSGDLKSYNIYAGNNLHLGGELSSGIQTLANDATPSISGGTVWLTGGVIAITDFDDGNPGNVIVVIAEHAITITDGTNIFLNGSVNFNMNATDTLVLIQKADSKWYEIARSDNT